ncbi:MAG: aminoglycoside phosphotransferase family protein [Gemmatimonadota bacterium]|nr:aminoglycoside phosphotransferase family protein [Gemmatimonadota bacterium]
MDSPIPIDAYESIIRDRLDDLVESFVRIDEGWTHIVLEVNGKWIFRFVRDPSNTQLVVEQAFLPLFKGHSPLPIPQIWYSGANFTAYEKIEGVKFSEAIFKRLDRNERTRLAASLGDFLSSLHAVTFEHRHLKPAPFGGGDFWDELWPAAAPRLQTSARKRAETYFHRALSRIASAAYPNVVTHSDFGTSNVLIHPARREIAGVIDFGDISIGDPATDFATFYRRFGKPFAEDMAKNYRLPLGDDFWTRVDFHSKRKLFFVLFFALNHGFDEHAPGIVRAIEFQFAGGGV